MRDIVCLSTRSSRSGVLKNNKHIEKQTGAKRPQSGAKRPVSDSCSVSVGVGTPLIARLGRLESGARVSASLALFRFINKVWLGWF